MSDHSTSHLTTKDVPLQVIFGLPTVVTCSYEILRTLSFWFKVDFEANSEHSRIAVDVRSEQPGRNSREDNSSENCKYNALKISLQLCIVSLFIIQELHAGMTRH